MGIEVMFFGQLTDITGCEKIEMLDVSTIDQLKNGVLEKFPVLMNSKFAIALNNEMVTENLIIPENSKIAFMPPFSGG